LLRPILSIWQVYQYYKSDDDELKGWTTAKQKWNKVKSHLQAGWNVDIDVEKALKTTAHLISSELKKPQVPFAS